MFLTTQVFVKLHGKVADIKKNKKTTHVNCSPKFTTQQNLVIQKRNEDNEHESWRHLHTRRRWSNVSTSLRKRACGLPVHRQMLDSLTPRTTAPTVLLRSSLKQGNSSEL